MRFFIQTFVRGRGIAHPLPNTFSLGVQVYKLEDTPARLEEITSFEEHDDMASCVTAALDHDGLVLSGSSDRRYSRTFVETVHHLSSRSSRHSSLCAIYVKSNQLPRCCFDLQYQGLGHE